MKKIILTILFSFFCIFSHAETYYEILGVSPNASQKEIKDAYHRLAMRYHPDVSPLNLNERTKTMLNSIMAAINDVYGILSDPEKRAAYDRFLNEKIVIDGVENDGVENDGVLTISHDKKKSIWIRIKNIFMPILSWIRDIRSISNVYVPSTDGIREISNVNITAGDDVPLLPAPILRITAGDDVPLLPAPTPSDNEYILKSIPPARFDDEYTIILFNNDVEQLNSKPFVRRSSYSSRCQESFSR